MTSLDMSKPFDDLLIGHDVLELLAGDKDWFPPSAAASVVGSQETLRIVAPCADSSLKPVAYLVLNRRDKFVVPLVAFTVYEAASTVAGFSQVVPPKRFCARIAFPNMLDAEGRHFATYHAALGDALITPTPTTHRIVRRRGVVDCYLQSYWSELDPKMGSGTVSGVVRAE